MEFVWLRLYLRDIWTGISAARYKTVIAYVLCFRCSLLKDSFFVLTREKVRLEKPCYKIAPMAPVAYRPVDVESRKVIKLFLCRQLYLSRRRVITLIMF